MKRSPVARWTPVGFLGVAVIALVGLPALTAAAGFGENTVLASFFTSSDQATLSEPPDQSDTDPAVVAAKSWQSAVLPIVEAAVNMASGTASAATQCQLGETGIDRAREMIRYQEFEEADHLLTILLDDDCIDSAESRDQARFQHAYLLLRLERPEASLQRLDAIETDPPIQDYLLWLRADALEKLERYDEAADAYFAIYEPDDSPLHWRARAQQAHALVAAEQWEQAYPAVKEIVDRFPDYPRRHRTIYEYGQVLEALERPEDAARAYQMAHFEFPFKAEGQAAQQRLDVLSEQGFAPAPIDREVRYEKYHQLSVDKFWPLAHQLLTDLRSEFATPQGNSEFENKILQRIALNTYHRHDFEGAADYFRQARDIFEAGHEDGFEERTIYRYHSFSLARIGRYEEAREALETLHDDSARDRKQAIAEFYERYGRYEEAYQLYDEVYSAYQKRDWHFSYLQYKTGRFEEAYDSLRRLARRSRGETRAKYLYWSARSLERAGNDEDAAELFAEIHQTRTNSYYGIQSANRLLDLNQRDTVDDSFIAQADQVGDSVDPVLDAFDAPGAVASGPAAYEYYDPRTVPLSPTRAEEIAEPLWDRDVPGLVAGESCTDGTACNPDGLGLPFPTYGLTWELGHSLMDPRMSEDMQPAQAEANWEGEEQESIKGLDDQSAREARIPRQDVEFPGENIPRVRFDTEARIYWHGRLDSEIGFAKYAQGKMIGPSPRQWTAYDDDTHFGGLERAIESAGHLFPELERAHWLWTAGWNTEARRLIRDVSLEFRGISRRGRPGSSPHQLPYRRWAYYIDNRRRSSQADYWGMHDNERRFPVPEDHQARQELLERQQSIYTQRRDLEPILIEAFQEVGDYHLVRRHALDDTWWIRQEPEGEARRYWAMAYPRGFPEQVIPLAEEHNINPYMIWALMLVESSFNPDSISIADAKGLLQVIPRTGLKIAELFGAEDFGPFDLLEADNSIEHGIFYFSRLVEKFHGQELMAFAGYNGGPHRVGGWLDMRGHNISLDEFVEEIPFTQSRDYAKKVLRFLNVYLHIYEDYEDGLYVGQNVRADYRSQPNF